MTRRHAWKTQHESGALITRFMCVRSNIIYGLVDPRTKMVRYVGLSTTGMRRPRNHATPSQLKEQSDKNTWIRALRALGLSYEVVVLEETDSRPALLTAERWWIAFGRACGWPLTNLTDGGDGVRRYWASTHGKKVIAQRRAEAALQKEIEWRVSRGMDLRQAVHVTYRVWRRKGLTLPKNIRARRRL